MTGTDVRVGSYRQLLNQQTLNKIDEKIKELKKNEDSTKGVKRDSNKKVFNKYKRFFEIVMRKWIADHEEKINYFYHNLHILFCKVSEFHDINPKEWIEQIKRLYENQKIVEA